VRLGNILYIHIPRTGGTHFEKLLGFKGHEERPPCGNFRYPVNHKEIMGWDGSLKIMLQHATYHQITSLPPRFGTENNNDLNKISIVRNPYNRAVSLYNYFGGEKKHGSFESFLNELQSGKINNYFYRPQWEYLDGADFDLIRFENYCEDVDAISKKFNLNIQCSFNKRKHVTQAPARESLLTEANMKKISELYRKDFESFSYPTSN